MEFVGDEAALCDVLQGRDARAAQQKILLARYNKPLISFTVNMPGPVKLCEASRYIYARGLLLLRQALKQANLLVVYDEMHEKISGPEALLVVNTADATALKALTCGVEDALPLGRLFDLDVWVPPRSTAPLARQALGLARRACLVCGAQDGICAPTRAHSVPLLLEQIEKRIAADREAST